MSRILTYTGKMFDPLNPEEELLDIRDIAHALSMLCRANGHFKTFHSVGQHSISCMKEAKARGYSPRLQLACLLHDASEAYLSDVTRPVKAQLPQYKGIEEPLQAAIWKHFLGTPLDEEESRLVFRVDDDCLAHEFFYFTGVKLADPLPGLCSQPDYGFLSFQHTEEELLQLFRELTQEEHT